MHNRIVSSAQRVNNRDISTGRGGLRCDGGCCGGFVYLGGETFGHTRCGGFIDWRCVSGS